MFGINNKNSLQTFQATVNATRAGSAEAEMSAALERIFSVLHHVDTSAFRLTDRYRIHSMGVFLNSLNLPTLTVTAPSSSGFEGHSSSSLTAVPTMANSSSIESANCSCSQNNVMMATMEMTTSSGSSSSVKADYADSHTQEAGCSMALSASAKRSFSFTSNSRSLVPSTNIDSLSQAFHSQSPSSDLSQTATSISRRETQCSVSVSTSLEDTSFSDLHFSSGEHSLSQDQTVASQRVTSSSSSSVFSVLRDSRDNFFETSLESSDLSGIKPNHIEEAMRKVFGKTGYELGSFAKSGEEELSKAVFSYFYFWILITPQQLVNFERSSDHYRSSVEVVRNEMRTKIKFAEKFYQCWNLIQTLSRNAT